MVSLKLMTSLAFQCLRYIFLRNYLNIQYQWVFLKLYSSFVIKKITMHFSTAIYMNCTSLWWRLLVLYNPKFVCILTGTLPRWLHVPNESDKKKSPRMEDSVNKRPTQQQRKTNEKGPPTVFRKSLGFILSIVWFFVITQESFLLFRHFEKNVVRCFMFQRQIMAFPPWQRNNFNVINVTTYAKLWNICNPQPKATIVWCIYFYNFTMISV